MKGEWGSEGPWTPIELEELLRKLIQHGHFLSEEGAHSSPTGPRAKESTVSRGLQHGSDISTIVPTDGQPQQDLHQNSWKSLFERAEIITVFILLTNIYKTHTMCQSHCIGTNHFGLIKMIISYGSTSSNPDKMFRYM